MKSLIYTTFACLMLLSGVSSAAPKPAIVQGPLDWTVNATYQDPMQIVVQLPGKSQPQRFWYIILTLTNKTGNDVEFFPRCELMTDTLQIIPAGQKVPDTVFQQIKKRHKKVLPFLESLEKSSAKILQGEDNSKDIAIIWPDFDAKAKNITLYIAGLSNETAAITHPIAKDEYGKPLKVFLRKTLELNYDIGGDPKFRSDPRLLFKSKRWIMR